MECLMLVCQQSDAGLLPQTSIYFSISFILFPRSMCVQMILFMVDLYKYGNNFSTSLYTSVPGLELYAVLFLFILANFFACFIADFI